MKSSRKILSVVAVLALAFCVFAVAMPTEQTDAASGDDITYVSGTIDKDMTFYNGNKVVVDKDLSIKNGAVLTIADGAMFTVNEGVTITINTLTTDSSTEKSQLFVSSLADVNVNGTITVGENGTLAMQESITASDSKGNQIPYDPADGFEPGFLVNGTIAFQSGSNSASIDGTITVGTTGTITVSSVGTKIGAISGATINMMPGATFKLMGIANVTITTVSATLSEEYTVSATAILANSAPAQDYTMTSAKVSNLTFTASAQTYTAYDTGDNGVYRYQVDATSLDITGTIQNYDTIFLDTEDSIPYAADRNDLTEMSYADASVTVSQNLTVGTNGKISIGSVLDVSGTVTVTNKDAETIAIVDGADITVTGTVSFNASAFKEAGYVGALAVNGGTVTIAGCEDPASLQIGQLYGAYYVVPGAESCTAYIVDLSVAIDAAANDSTITSVYVYGEKNSETAEDYEGGYVVTQSFTVPSGISLIVSNALIVNKDVTITVPVDAFVDVSSGMAPGVIVVNGKIIDSSLTLFLKEEGVRGVVSEVTISSDEGATITYTSLAIAISEATPGSTIELAGDAIVKGELTIPEDITVVVGDNTLAVDNDSNLIVDGVLNAAVVDSVVTAPVNQEKNLKAGVVTVNNIVIRNINDAYDVANYNISGVYSYGEVDGISGVNYFIMPLAVFAQYSDVLADAEVQGTVNCTENVVLAAAEDEELEITIVGTLNATSITIDGYAVTIAENGVFNGTVANAEGSVTLSNVMGDANNITIADTTYDEADRLTVNGTLSAAKDTDGADLKVSMTVDGTVYISNMNISVLKTFTVLAETTANITGTVTVGDCAVVIAGTMNVEGSLANVSSLSVTGTVTVDDTGVLSATNAYLGMTAEDVSKGNATSETTATINGTASLATVYAAPGAVLSERITDMDYVEFYVEDVLWMTVYSDTVGTITVDKAPVQNAVFENWANADGDNLGYVVAIDGSYDSVTAVIDYEIYDVMVLADNGVGTVAIDGVVLMKSSNVFIATGLTAGTHTISVDAKSGYSADNVVIQVNGQTISGNTFTLSGTPEAGYGYVEVTITVSGTAVSDPVVIDDSDSGMGITDYLLIILVVLVIVLAVIVAMRMMRS